MTWPIIKLFLGGLWQRLLGALSAAFRWIRENPLPAIIIALCLALAWTWHGKHKAEQRIASIEAAQKTATTAQVAVNHEPARKSQALAEKSDAEAPAYYEQGRLAGVAYANAHRVPAACAPRVANLPGADNAPQEHDGPGDAPGMVALSQADFDTLSGNSTRLARVHADAEALIDAGVAVASPN